MRPWFLLGMLRISARRCQTSFVKLFSWTDYRAVNITSRIQDRVAVLEIAGTVDMYEGYQLRDVVKNHLRNGSRHFIFDCRRVNYVDSTGLGIFMQARELAQDAGGGISLVAPSPAFQKVLTTTQVDRLLPIFASQEAALAAVQE